MAGGKGEERLEVGGERMEESSEEIKRGNKKLDAIQLAL